MPTQIVVTPQRKLMEIFVFSFPQIQNSIAISESPSKERRHHIHKMFKPNEIISFSTRAKKIIALLTAWIKGIANSVS
jgi:hypothetical protein